MPQAHLPQAGRMPLRLIVSSLHQACFPYVVFFNFLNAHCLCAIQAGGHDEPTGIPVGFSANAVIDTRSRKCVDMINETYTKFFLSLSFVVTRVLSANSELNEIIICHIIVHVL